MDTCLCDQDLPKFCKKTENHMCVCTEFCDPSVCRALPEHHPCTCINSSNDTSTCRYIGLDHECICNDSSSVIKFYIYGCPELTQLRGTGTETGTGTGIPEKNLIYFEEINQLIPIINEDVLWPIL